MLFVLFPSAGTLNSEQQAGLQKAVLGRFNWVWWSVIFLLLASGLYNVKLVWLAPQGTYWKFLTIKIALSLVVFIVVLFLTIPLSIFNWFRKHSSIWLSIALVLALMVILLSAYLRRG
ncbi:MAG TPA: hypothetical protein VFQ24_00585 [Terriglobia bacterium]|nr:hypothetical protein [Terriglobia bacterium]